MGQYIPNTFADDDAINAAALNAEFGAIETANNELKDADIPADEITWAKLDTPKTNFALSLAYETTVPAGQTDLKVAQLSVPCNCTLLDVKVNCIARNSGNESVDIWDEGAGPAATILSASLTLAAVDTTYKAGDGETVTITTTSFSEDDIISLRATTPAGDSIDGIQATLLFEANYKDS